MYDWFRLAFSRSIVRRSIYYAVVVGTILVSINYGDVILRGEIDAGQMFKMGLTVLVPYLVSTTSSVATMRECDKT